VIILFRFVERKKELQGKYLFDRGCNLKYHAMLYNIDILAVKKYMCLYFMGFFAQMYLLQNIHLYQSFFQTVLNTWHTFPQLKRSVHYVNCVC